MLSCSTRVVQSDPAAADASGTACLGRTYVLFLRGLLAHSSSRHIWHKLETGPVRRVSPPQLRPNVGSSTALRVLAAQIEERDAPARQQAPPQSAGLKRPRRARVRREIRKWRASCRARDVGRRGAGGRRGRSRRVVRSRAGGERSRRADRGPSLRLQKGDLRSLLPSSNVLARWGRASPFEPRSSAPNTQSWLLPVAKPRVLCSASCGGA